MIEPFVGKEFRENLKKHKIKHVLSHSTYLINPAASDALILEKSLGGLISELVRCEALGINYAVLHPGAGGATDRNTALKRAGNTISKALDIFKGKGVRLLLENTAGSGSALGSTIEELDFLIECTGGRAGVCMDTCHAFAAGYDIRTLEGLDVFLNGFDKLIGLENLCAFHFNDSKGALGSHLDRHEHIGKGMLGTEVFRELVIRFPDRPKVLETSHDDDHHLRDLEILRNFK